MSLTLQTIVDFINNNDGVLQALAMLGAGGSMLVAWFLQRRKSKISQFTAVSPTEKSGNAESAKSLLETKEPIHNSPPRLLVLPFVDNTATEEDDFLIDGLTEDIVAGLAKSHWLLVLDSGTSFSFKSKTVEPIAVGKELDVQYVVHGRILRSKDNLRASLFLVDVEGGSILWSEQFTCEVSELFDMQKKIVTRVIGSIEPASLHHQSLVANKRSQNLQQWELVMKARFLFWKTSKETTAKARILLEQALEIDPDDSKGLGLLAMTHLNDVWHGWTSSTPESLKLADITSLKAVNADPEDPWAHHTRSAVTGTLRNLDQAEADLKRALSLNPHLAPALGDMTRILAFAGKTEGAIEFAERAVDASPRDPHLALWYYWIAVVHFVDCDYSSALPWLEKVGAIRPDWMHPRILRGACMGWLGRSDDIHGTQILESIKANKFSLKSVDTSHPFQDASHLERLYEGLKRVGWLDEINKTTNIDNEK